MVPAQGGLLQPLEQGLLASPPGIYGPVAVADFDLDGDPDLLRRDGVLFNDGGGRFTSTGNSPGGIFACIIFAAAADFDGDGDPDVVGMGCGMTMVYALNDGLGNFSAAPSGAPLGQGGEVSQLHVANLNGDSYPDIVGALNVPGQLSATCAWINAGGAGFTLFTIPSSATNWPIAIDDFDGDGRDDIVIVEGPSFAHVARVARFTGAGFILGAPLTQPSAHVYGGAGDWNGDGIADLVISVSATSNPVAPVDQLRWGSPLGIGPVVASTAHPSLANDLLPFDLDGIPPLEAIRAGNQGVEVVSVGVRGSTAVISTLPAPRVTRLLADFDMDGDVDVLAETTGETLRVLFNAGGSLVEYPGTFDASFASSSARVLTGDFDGDGDVDVASADLGELRVNDGRGVFSPSPVVPPAGFQAGARYGCIADFDGDGRDDWFSASTLARGAHAVFYSRSGSWAVATAPSPLFDGIGVAAGDVDLDGDPDVVVVGYVGVFPALTRRVELVRNLGNGMLAVEVLDTTHVSHDVALIDFDGDGDLDVIQANGRNLAAPDFSVVRLNDGTGNFVEAPLPFAVQAYRVAAGDLDADSDTDLVFDGAAWIRTGTGWVAAPQAPFYLPPTYGWHQLADLDLDGLPELLTEQGWHRGLGAAGFLPRTKFLGAWSVPVPVAGFGVRDLDLDGDPDLVLATPLVLWNCTRHLSRGAVARPGRPASLEIRGAAASPAILVVALGPAVPAIPVPPFGTVLLDLATATFLPPLTLDGNGFGSLTVGVPASPTLVGASLSWQAILPFANRLTGVEQTTILGF
jgi:hypothetical protein